MFTPILSAVAESVSLEIPDLVLLLIHRAGGRAGFSGVTRLEKLLFLLDREGSLTESTEVPHFEAYKYGPFSQDVYDALEFLRSIDLMEADESDDRDETAEMNELAPDVAAPYAAKRLRLTPRGLKVVAKLMASAPPTTLAAIDSVVSSYGRMPLRELIEYVYRKYPSYTSKSLIRRQVLGY